jgi:calcineurin-like phosphoesterase family protein
MSRTWFTADTHFGHANIIKLCDRPFTDVAEMDEVMIENWNAAVGKNDQVFHLGDFAYRADPRHARKVFDKLHGQKFLIWGNHDDARTRELKWSDVSQIREVAVDGQRLVLCHYAMRSWNALHRNSMQLYGHSHGKLPGTYHSQDVGVDDWGFAPVSWPDIKARLDARPRPEQPQEIDEAAQPGGLTVP